MTETIVTNAAAEETKQEEAMPMPPALPSEYYAMVVDSGPIIKQDVRNLMGKAQTYVTTPGVMREIRDSRARDHLENAVLPLLDLKLREPSDKAIQDIIAFAKQTGDYASLSTVDLQVLALTLDLEREGNLISGNTNLDHIRTTPKRKIGLGAIRPMNGKSSSTKPTSPNAPAAADDAPTADTAAADASDAAASPAQEEKEGGEDEAVDAGVDAVVDAGVDAGTGAASDEKPISLGREDYDEVEESDGEEDESESEDQEEQVKNKLVELMRLKMVSNTANMRNTFASKVSTTKESLLKLNPNSKGDRMSMGEDGSDYGEIDAEYGETEAEKTKKMPAALNQMKMRMSQNTAKMRESLTTKVLTTKETLMTENMKIAENTAKMRDNIASKLKLNVKKTNPEDEEVVAQKGDIVELGEAEAAEKGTKMMPEKLNQMKLRMSENTNQLKMRMAENTANMKNSLGSMLNIKNKKNDDAGNDVVEEATQEEAQTNVDAQLTTEDSIDGEAEEVEDEAAPSVSPTPTPTPPVEETASENTSNNASSPETESPPPTDPQPPVKKSWATLVNPSAASAVPIQDPAPVLPFAKMSLKPTKNDDDETGGQFDDASEDEDEEPQNAVTTEEELELEFPSLLAASTVPYEGEDDDINATSAEDTANQEKVDRNPHHRTRASVFMTEEEKQENLKPISKSGRTYNSFRKYKGLMKPKQPKKKTESVEEESDDEAPQLVLDETVTNTESMQPQGSRFLGGGGGGETMNEEDDDGQGWITSADDIKFMKSEGGGRLDPGKTGTVGGSNNNSNNAGQTKKPSGPHMSQRTACATTDFAMQNVLLQMNLILLSTEGMRIRRLKSWVIRCGACFHIHGADQDFSLTTGHHMKRLFCSHCGSGDMMQRISASVDGKTGRLKLHFSKRKQGRHHSIRGTKFALPKPGTNNKYKGDLLLREDQLLSGAWNQKVKINSGRKYQTSKSQSMFGRDIATSVGCNVKSTSSATFGGKGWASSANTSSMGGFGTNTDDIRVGFGARKNPNAAKGRERRGKKKKSTDRACGMRRY